ncbi:PKD domain-containing protein [Costertonia aggregata]|uniref:PKD domain-containing protein n=1 Tax=Costertonia aggregata TaxID=343403 RepID=A0A7H9AR51_9FLAO|nr:hypothetical protein [Costertonia aggregata]QLG45923.1 hypothetical protein HYG79_11370 [Costertonia aggregata]
MKKIYFTGLCLLSIMACTKETASPNSDPDSIPESDAKLKACFTVSKDTVSIGESLTINSCSKNAISFKYDFGNGTQSSEEAPVFTDQEGGAYTIELTVKNEAGDTETFNYPVYVKPAKEHYFFPDIADGFSTVSLETGINIANNTYYSLQLVEDAGTSKFYYSEIDENYQSTSNYIADKQFNSNSAFLNVFPSGNKNFHFSRTLADFYGTHEVTYNNAWGFLNGINSATKHKYGCIADGSFYLYYGAKKVDGVYKTAIERRNSSGDAFEEFINPIGDADSMLGDLILTESGYVAFGAKFNKNTTSPSISGYKPILVFYDTALNVTSHIVLEESVLDTKINSANDLNGTFHLEQLTNGNLVCYGNGELIITNASGSPIKTHYFEGTNNNQALLALGDTFIVSSKEYLRKFDANGNSIKNLKYKGLHLPEIIEKEDRLFFIGGYSHEEKTRIFYGATDKDLQLIDVNK